VTISQQKCSIKLKMPYCQKNIPQKSLYLVIMSNLTDLPDVNTNLCQEFYKKFMWDPKAAEKKDPDQKKIIPDPQHCSVDIL
jgi:hypothetical protein